MSRGRKGGNKKKAKRGGKKGGGGARPANPQPRATELAPPVSEEPEKASEEPEKKAPALSRIKKALSEALKGSTEEDRKKVSDDKRPPKSSEEDLWQMVKEARDIFLARAERAEKHEADAEEMMEELASKKEQLAKDWEALEQAKAEQEKDLKAREEELETENALRREKLNAEAEDIAALRTAAGAEVAAVKERTNELQQEKAAFLREKTTVAEHEAALTARELNAEAGFATERQQSLVKLTEAAEKLHDQMATTEARIATERAAWNETRTEERRTLEGELTSLKEKAQQERTELRQKLLDEMEGQRKEREDALAVQLEKLEGRKSNLKEAQRTLDGDQRQLQLDREELEEFKEELEERISRRVAALQERQGEEISALEQRLEVARKGREDLDEQLRAREEAARKFGDKDEDEVIKELDRLRDKCGQLKAELAQRPARDAGEKLDALEAHKESWEQERYALVQENQELKTRLARADVAGCELENQRDRREAAELRIGVLKEAVNTLRTEVDDLRQTAAGQTPFPACTEMDENDELQDPPSSMYEVKDLEAFVKDLQIRIAHDPAHSGPLYYSLRDLRSFLGGLAMGPLILLQGISGTGKTSLPCAFARAMTTEETLVEVQAGWRDPQDLVGYYNAFEKKFYEQELLKGLYRAQTPRFQDTVQMVVLDEMNLSHPEQYFSDLLSQLEQPVKKRRLTVMPHRAPSPPNQLIDGCRLPVPPNVWFVGTANHDETTKEFADKTYDRSHVMEFPHRPEPFNIGKEPTPRYPVSYGSLMSAFKEAQDGHKKDVAAAVSFLERSVRDPLERNFEVGWGPRLERQLQSYVPVVMAAGGSLGEAVDHVLATRLLRKLRNRHGNQRPDLQELRQQIESHWKSLDRGSPERSLEILRKELRRFGVTDEEEGAE